MAHFSYHREIIIISLDWKVRKNIARPSGSKSLQLKMFNGKQNKQKNPQKIPRQRMQCLVIIGSTNACIKYCLVLNEKATAAIAMHSFYSNTGGVIKVISILILIIAQVSRCKLHLKLSILFIFHIALQLFFLNKH